MPSWLADVFLYSLDVSREWRQELDCSSPVLEGIQENLLAPKRLASSGKLSGGMSRGIAILLLQYPISRDTFSGRLAAPQNGADNPH